MIGLLLSLGAALLADEQEDYATTPRRNAATDPHIGALFNALAEAQRGVPESAMLRIGMSPLGAGLYAATAEHVGDLIHRMSERPAFLRGQYLLVQDKVEKTLSWLVNEYGFQREVEGNLRGNFNYRAEHDPESLGEKTFFQLRESFLRLCQAYSDAHAALTPYNHVQRLAQGASVALGEWRFGDCIRNLEGLKAVLDQGREAWERAALDPGNAAGGPR